VYTLNLTWALSIDGTHQLSCFAVKTVQSFAESVISWYTLQMSSQPNTTGKQSDWLVVLGVQIRHECMIFFLPDSKDLTTVVEQIVAPAFQAVVAVMYWCTWHSIKKIVVVSQAASLNNSSTGNPAPST